MIASPAELSQPIVGSGRLRILILGWLIGKGSTGVYGAELAAYLDSVGHGVTCLSAGVCDWRLKAYTTNHSRGSVEYIEFRNPPIMACTRPNSPKDEISSPVMEEMLRNAVERHRPDVALILDFPGWPASTVDLFHSAGCKVAVFLQNFWPFCTRLTLVDRWGRSCRDYENGKRCLSCTVNVLGSAAARWRARLPSWMWQSAQIYRWLNRLYKAGAKARGVLNVTEGSGYASRREAYARAITSADVVYGISSRTLELATQFGVRTPNSRVLPIFLSHLQTIYRTRLNKDAIVAASLPLQFAYLGVLAPEKGIGTLISAFRGIPRDRAVLHCFGGGKPTYLKELYSLSDKTNPPVFHGPYLQSELSNILQGIHVGIVPSICEDTRPNTVLEFQAAGIPVIGSRIGGIPEQIDDGRNGRLFEAGNERSLRAALEELIASPESISAWRSAAPSDFDPQRSWKELEQALRDLVEAE